jgi:hypothetical protein
LKAIPSPGFYFDEEASSIPYVRNYHRPSGCPISSTKLVRARLATKARAEEMSSPPQNARLTEGIFVTSKKRPYGEFVFDSKNKDEDNQGKRKPGRRGPLKDSTREGVEKIKQEGGACWRCKILKKPVSRAEISILFELCPDDLSTV